MHLRGLERANVGLRALVAFMFFRGMFSRFLAASKSPLPEMNVRLTTNPASDLMSLAGGSPYHIQRMRLYSAHAITMA
jgi:hypothetical protein